MDSETQEALEPFFDLALITDVLYPVKSGKEAAVWACRAHPDTGMQFIAAKVYKDLRERGFRNDAVYQEGRWGEGRNPRERRAYEKGTEFGLEVHFYMWVGQEWEHLKLLHQAGVYVPTPVRHEGRVILMEYFGNELGPYPMLQHSRLAASRAGELWGLLKANIEMMLQADRVHGDLSPYNVLVNATSAADPMRIIDVPQLVDARFNNNARKMLEHDVMTCWRYFDRLGVRDNPGAFVNSLWHRWRRAEL